MSEPENVDPKQLRPGPIHNESLPPKLLEQMKAVFDSHLRPRQSHGERRAFADFAFNADGPFQVAQDGLANRQPQASAVPFAPSRIDPIETVEDVWKVFRWNSHS